MSTDINALAEEIGAILEREKDDEAAALAIHDAAEADDNIVCLTDLLRVLLPFAREGIAARKKQMEG